jgi:choline kinase
MSNNVTATQETKVTLSVQQLETIIRKVVREELVEFAAQELGIFHLDKESPLYEDMEDILERKKSGQLTFHTHDKIWNE